MKKLGLVLILVLSLIMVGCKSTNTVDFGSKESNKYTEEEGMEIAIERVKNNIHMLENWCI